MPYTAYIVDCCRTAAGKKKGALADWHPADLGATVLDALIERTGIPGDKVDDVIVGCVSQIGAQAGNIGRTMVLSSKHIPLTVPGTTVDRQCGSSQQAIHFAAQAVMSGVQNVVIAAGVESMTNVPIGSNVIDGYKADHGMPFNGKGIASNFPDQQLGSQFEGAELLAKKHGLTREELDDFGYKSHVKAVAAQKAGKFDAEIVPVKGKNKQGEEIVHKADEGVRANANLEQMKKLKPLKKDGGIVTAATSSQIADGASAVLIVNEIGLKELGLKPKAKIVALGLAGSDPLIMLEAPIPATEHAFKQSGLSMKDMDLYEVNEAFAPVPVAWAKALGADMDKLNVNGGACALGHPLGATGTKLMTTLVYEMERRGLRYGVQAICEGGGTGNATIIEMVTEADASRAKL